MILGIAATALAQDASSTERSQWVAFGHKGWCSRSGRLTIQRLDSWRIWLIDRQPVEQGIGCASVIPAAIMVVVGLADYAGPGGWRGLSEFLGWAGVCVAVGCGVGLLLAQRRQRDWRRYAAVPSALAAVAAFTYAPYWLGLDAPMAANVIFTTSLQIVGSLATAGLIVAFGYIFWTGRQHS